MRLIMNLIPVNAICGQLPGDVGLLPMLNEVSGVQLLCNERLMHGSEDLRCMFYLFRMPEQWQPYMSFNYNFRVEQSNEWHVLSSRVLGMGWTNSVGLASTYTDVY